MLIKLRFILKREAASKNQIRKVVFFLSHAAAQLREIVMLVADVS
jgi:hypothetical protein